MKQHRGKTPATGTPSITHLGTMNARTYHITTTTLYSHNKRNTNDDPSSTNGNPSTVTTANRKTTTTNLSNIFKASMLIAGTTVGGGFLALPRTVVVPLGSWSVTAASLVGVWAYFLAQSFVLVDCLVECQQRTKNNSPASSSSSSSSISNSNHTNEASVIGFPSLAKYALGLRGSWVATTLLVVLTEATLVSQISRAGSLLAENSGILGLGGGAAMGVGGMLPYRIGCILAAVIGAVVSFSGSAAAAKKGAEPNVEQLELNTYSSEEEEERNTEEKEAFDGSNETGSLAAATDFNALLTLVFLISAVLLFQAGSQTADWSRCFPSASTSGQTTTPIRLLQRILAATPTMLQLLAYGEILPNVCSMLRYHVPSIRTAIYIGSTIPLVLLLGWAGLGLALLPPVTIPTATAALLTSIPDPVDILIASGNGLIRTRLLVLAASAIGTTVLGCFLALESAYDDIVFSDRKTINTITTKLDPLPSIQNQIKGKNGASASAWWRGKQWRRSRVLKLTALVLPPLTISAISPTVFLRAIDFAGSYPVLLLWGVFPPLMALRIYSSSSKSPTAPRWKRGTPDKSAGSSPSSTAPRDDGKRQKFWYILLGFVSSAMVGMNSVRDLGGIVGFITSYVSN